jgi:cbb3-type cytochrome oxidase subunit 1
MSNITVNFIKCALVYLVFAALLGITMTIKGPVEPFKPMHTHFNLLGWMCMMIYGVAYHILPRFSGVPLWSEKLATIHLWVANIGLLGMAGGWVFMSMDGSFVPLHIFSIVEAVSIVLFVVNMFKTVKASPPFKAKLTPKPAAKA